MTSTLSIDSGTSVDPDALDAAAARLALLAAELGGIGAEIAAVVTDPVLLLSAAVAPSSAAAVASETAELLLGRRSPVAVAAALATLAVEVEAAALRYRVGDEAADAVMAAVRRAVAEAVVEFAPEIATGVAVLVVADTAHHLADATFRVVAGAYDQAVTTGTVDLDELALDAAEEFGAVPDEVAADLRTVGTFLAAHPELTQEIVATTPHVLAAVEDRHPELGAALTVLAPEARAEGGVAGVAGTLTALGTVSPLFRETGVVVRPVSTPRAIPSRPPRGVAEILDGVAHQSTGHSRDNASLNSRLGPADQPEPGTVRLERITQPDGTVGWIVEIPGTQDWNPLPVDGGTPMDLTTNLRAVAGEPTATADAVVQAMRASGVVAGEQVMFAGHSQGGLTAAALAADPTVLAEFSITHVVTAGSPVDGVEIGDGVRVLSLEHTGDLVPALDGETARGSAQRTVVARDVGETPDDPLVAHGSTGYIATAELVDGSRDPALQDFRSSGSVFFDAPGATVEAFDHYAERVG